MLGAIFIYASLDKIAYPEEFVGIVQGYGILPRFSVRIVAYLLPWVELIFGILLIVGLFVNISAAMLSSLLVVFMLAMGIRSLSGPIEDCGCFSSFSLLPSKNIPLLIFRDTLFLSFGLILFITNRSKKRKFE
jgi:uncharacterized membrane protein YphA (DoxX/SURF4 family)